MRRMAAAHDLRTVGDFLEFRFGVAVRVAITALLWFGAIFILAGQLIAIATILNVVVRLPWAAGCVLGGALVTIYFTAGGLLTSVWVNVVQLTVKLGGFALALPLAISGVGGWTSIAALHPHPAVLERLEQRALGPGLPRRARPGVHRLAGAAAEDLRRAGRPRGPGWRRPECVEPRGVCMVPVVLGMVARVRYPGLPSPDLALPMVLVHGVPAAVGGLGLAAVFSAELSAADAALFMLTTSLSQDLYRRFVAPDASDVQMLRITRITAVVAGTLGVVVALAAASVITALTIFYTLMSVSLFVPILGGLYVPRARSPEALGAIAAGITVVVLRHFMAGGVRFYGLTPAMAGVGAAAVVFVLIFVSRRGGGPGPSPSSG